MAQVFHTGFHHLALSGLQFEVVLLEPVEHLPQVFIVLLYAPAEDHHIIQIDNTRFPHQAD